MSKMKKTVCLFLCALMLMGVFQLAYRNTASAADFGVRIEPGDITNGVLPVTIYLTGAVGFLDGDFDFNYDPSVFSVQNTVEGDADITEFNTQTAGLVRFLSLYYLGDGYCTEDTMKLCEIHLKVLNSSASATTVSLYANCDFPNKEKKTINGLQTIKFAHTHTYASTYTIDKKATLTENGSKSRHCTECGEKGYKTVIYKIKTVKLSKTAFVVNGKVQKPTVVVKDSKGKTVSSKYYTVTYSNAKSKAVGTYSVTVKFKGAYSGTKKLTYKIIKIGKVTGIEQIHEKGIYFRWDKVKGADGYEVYISPANSNEFKKVATQSNNRLKNSNLSISIKVKVRAYKTVDGKKIYGEFSKIVKMSPVK